MGLVYVGDGATSTGAFHEGINFAAVQRCPLVVIVENNGYAYSTPHEQADRGDASWTTRRSAYGVPGERPTATMCSRSYDVTRRAVDRARRGEGVTLIELITYRRKGHAEHDNQSYVPAGEIERWERTTTRSTATCACCSTSAGDSARRSSAIDDARARRGRRRDRLADASPMPEADDALAGVYADPPRVGPLWYRGGVGAAVASTSAPPDWGTHDG